jgi:outer membrane protein OmpA-like peptidoglycan-associated protein
MNIGLRTLLFLVCGALLATTPIWTLTGPVAAQDEFDEDEFDEEEFDEDDQARSSEDADSPGDSEDDDFDDSSMDGDLAAMEAEAGIAPEQGMDEGSSDDEDSADDELSEEELEARYARLFRTHNSWSGSVGGIRVVDAGSGEPGSFRVHLATEFFSSSDFLIEGGNHGHLGASLSLSWTVHEMVELYGAVFSSADSSDAAEPSLLMVLGDFMLGTKVFGQVAPAITIGGDLGLYAVNPVANVGLSLGDMAVDLGANLSADFRELEDPLPIIARLNLGYTFDNSGGLINGVEQSRYENLMDAEPIENETRHLVTARERFSLGINRVDRFEIGIGAEFPIELESEWGISPLLEWTWSIPVNRQGYNCLFIPAEPGGDAPAPGTDGCLDRAGVSAFPMDLSLGLRVLTPVTGLSAQLAVDIGLTGSSSDSLVREIAPNAPYAVMLALGWAYKDKDPLDPEIIEREVINEVEVEGEEPVIGRIRGVVTVEGEDTPIAGARIAFPGRDLTSLSTSADGTFVSYAMEADAVIMEVTHPDYHPGGCVATLPEGGADVSVRCELAIPLVVLQDSEVSLLQQINFGTDSAEILSSSFPLMGQISDILRINPELRAVQIQGHTDDQGTRQYNQQLSERRANSVRDWLINAGIADSRLTARGFGMDQPIVPGNSDEARASNRRVQFLISVRD